MRLIDADKLLEELNGFSMRITGSANALALSVMHETKKSIAKMIDEQETAYDVDKVCDKLDDYLFERYCVEGDSKVDEIVKSGGTNGH